MQIKYRIVICFFTPFLFLFTHAKQLQHNTDGCWVARLRSGVYALSSDVMEKASAFNISIIQ